VRVAERLREAVAEIVLPTEREALSFTISIGVSSYTKGMRLDQVIGVADQALYAAKQGGRNRVCAGPEPAAQPVGAPQPAPA